MSGTLPIGRRVAQARVEAGLSQQQLADRLGLSKSWVDKVERGIRRLDRVSVRERLADALGADPFSAPPAAEPPRHASGPDLLNALGARLRGMLDVGDPCINEELLRLYEAGVTLDVLATALGRSPQAVSYRVGRARAGEVPRRRGRKAPAPRPTTTTLRADDEARITAMYTQHDPGLNAELRRLHRGGVTQADLAAVIGITPGSMSERITRRPAPRSVPKNRRPAELPAADAVRLRAMHGARDPALNAELARLHHGGASKAALARALRLNYRSVSARIDRPSPRTDSVGMPWGGRGPRTPLAPADAGRVRAMLTNRDPGLNAELARLCRAGVTRIDLGSALGITAEAVGHRVAKSRQP